MQNQDMDGDFFLSFLVCHFHVIKNLIHSWVHTYQSCISDFSFILKCERAWTVGHAKFLMVSNSGITSCQNRIPLPLHSLCAFHLLYLYFLLYFYYQAIPVDSNIYLFMLFNSGFVFTPPPNEQHVLLLFCWSVNSLFAGWQDTSSEVTDG